MRPEKRIANPTTAIAQAAAAALREQTVPSAISGKPTPASDRYAVRRRAREPANSARTSIENDPNAEKMVVCGLPMTLSANANTAGMKMAARAALLSEVRSESCASRYRRTLLATVTYRGVGTARCSALPGTAAMLAHVASCCVPGSLLERRPEALARAPRRFVVARLVSRRWLGLVLEVPCFAGNAEALRVGDAERKHARYVR